MNRKSNGESQINSVKMNVARSQFCHILAASVKWQRVRAKLLSVALVAAVLGAPSLGVAQTAPMRQPLGIYYRLVIQPDTDVNVTNTVTAALTNSAISGILAVFGWDTLNPINPSSRTNLLFGTNDFHLLDDVFGTVGQWNAAHSTNLPKNIQLGINPGFNTPTWLISNLLSCDAMFLTNSQGSIVNSNANGLALVGVDTSRVTNTCGCAGFLESESKGNPRILQLPLPWNQSYKTAWSNFIQAVAEKYGTNPLLVSITVAGPTASSSEMILPNETNDTTNYLKWNPLFALEFPKLPQYTNSDAIFIKQWEDAIDLFGGAFSNLTLVVTTGSGLPNFLDAHDKPDGNYSIPLGFSPDCGSTNSGAEANIMDCAAETTILAYFADPRHGGRNAKAVQADGLRASGVHYKGDLGSHGIKWLAQATAGGPTPLAGTSNVVSRLIGGLQVGDGAVITQNPDTVGCPRLGGGCSNIFAEQAIYNVMASYFDGTLVGTNYGSDSTGGSAPLNYLQIYYDDVIYANTNGTGSLVVDGFGNTNLMTAQMLLTKASQEIAEIADLDLNVQAVGREVLIRWLASAAATQLQVNHKLSNTNGWAPDTHTPILTNGFYQISLNPLADASFFRLATPLSP